MGLRVVAFILIFALAAQAQETVSMKEAQNDRDKGTEEGPCEEFFGCDDEEMMLNDLDSEIMEASPSLVSVEDARRFSEGYVAAYERGIFCTVCMTLVPPLISTGPTAICAALFFIPNPVCMSILGPLFQTVVPNAGQICRAIHAC